MPGQTQFGLPYPLPTDPVSAGADDIRRLAEAIDAGSHEFHAQHYFGARVFVSFGAAEQISMEADGRLYFGPSPYDTALFRSAAGVIGVTSGIHAYGQIWADQAGIISTGPSGQVVGDAEARAPHVRATSSGYYGDPYLGLFNIGAYPAAETGWIKLYCENPSGKVQLKICWPGGATTVLASEP